MRCSHCDSDNPDSGKFCGNCGAPLIHRCANCNTGNPPSFKFCGQCGTPLTARSTVKADSASTLTPGQFANVPLEARLPEGERKTVTALFADIKGSTELMRDLD